MKISLNWLKKYIDIPISVDVLIAQLPGIGFDIESVEKQADKYNNFVIGKVLERVKHPNADKLSLCKVDIGSEVLSVVCGAPNVDAGQTICFAKVGAIIPNGEFELKKAKIRGEVSEGMICSAKEMNLGEDHAGIMVLDDRIPIGHPFAEYIGADDVILDIAITPNRADLLSHFGSARDIYPTLPLPQGEGMKKIPHIRIPEIELTESKDKIENYIKVEIENPDGCYRYCGRLVRNVKVKESPEWLKKLLTSVGLRPINNVVDVSNFVMMECGQPLHTFDYDLIGGKKIIVKNAGNTKKFTTLDDKERELREGVLLICDAEKPVALAGIMGGQNSEIKDTTTNVFIESAYFDPVVTRRSSKFLGLQTDSSYRFERGIDMSKTDWACDRAAQMIAELGGGEVVSGLIDNYPHKLEKRMIELDVNYVSNVIGMKFEAKQIIDLLNKIEIECKEQSGDKLTFAIPFARYNDLERDVDLIEEVTRLYGYEKISGMEYDKLFYDIREFDNHEYEFVNDLRYYLAGRGFKEIVTNSFVNEPLAKLFNDNLIKVLNPSNVDMNVLRNNLYIGALETVRNNFNFKSDKLKLFEIGEIFEFTDDTKTLVPHVKERRSLALTLAGESDFHAVNQKSRYFDIFDLKGELKALLEKLNIDNYKLNYYNYKDFYDFRIDYFVKEVVFASIYSFSKKVLNNFDINKPVIIGEIFITELLKYSKNAKIYKEISKYPPVLRDLSVVVGKNVKVHELEDEITKEAGNLLKELNLYDVFEPGDDADKISYTFSLEYSSDEKTLTDEEINRIQDKVIKKLNKKLNAELRT